tara:strand:+ start:286 stop:1863 length:1578 start_codon:yes stop_codon:yes gene_type:complete
MANGYGGSSGSSSSASSSSSATQVTTPVTRLAPPPGFHYMPDGTLMSDIEHEKLFKTKPVGVKTKIIRDFNINLRNVKASGENRSFSIVGDAGCVFTLIILNNHGSFYNFVTDTFTTASSSLQGVLEGGSYKGNIVFPALPDTNTDDYTINLIANINENTFHTNYTEVRYPDNTINLNSSKGSDSAVVIKKIYQHVDKTITLTAVSPNSLTPFNSMVRVEDTITVAGGTSSQKKSFTITVTAATTRNFVINRQPIENDVLAFVNRTIGSAGLAITGENTLEGSRFYRWPLDNIIGLKKGMFVAPSTNLDSGSSLADYVVTVEETKTSNTRASSVLETYKVDTIVTFVNAIESTARPTLTNGVVTSQPGNIVFSKQQVDALKDDGIKIYGYGPSSIKSLSGYDVKFSNLKVELTPVTTTTTSSTIGSASTSVVIAERDGIRDDVSTVTGIGIDTSSAIPFVDSGAGTVSGAGTIVLSAAQELESGITLTFGGASRIATITGDIEVLEAGAEDVSLRFDLEKILTAT